MDEIWENIHLNSSLHRPNADVPTNSSASHHLRDFLPIFKKVNPPPPPSPPSFTLVDNNILGITNTIVKSPCTTCTITALNLRPMSRESRNVTKKSKSKQQQQQQLRLQQPQQQVQLQQQRHKVKLVPCVTCCNSNNNNNNNNSNKRLAEELVIDENSAEGRFKRMIKNRESAARSRDKKHAYINELELELTRLKKENAVLRKQEFMLRMPADPPTQIPKKPTLYRTLTAPF